MRTEVIPDLAVLWDRYEATYRNNMYDGTAGHGSARLISSPSRMLLTAPHAVNHFRYGKVKWADRWTGGLCELLANRGACSALIPDGPVPSWNEWDDRTDPFMQLLKAQQPRFVLDVHGMSDNHDSDICLGLGPVPDSRSLAYAAVLEESLTDDGYRVTVNQPFDATADFTVTALQQRTLHSSALQMEIRAGLRDPASAPDVASRFATSLESVLRALELNLDKLA